MSNAGLSFTGSQSFYGNTSFSQALSFASALGAAGGATVPPDPLLVTALARTREDLLASLKPAELHKLSEIAGAQPWPADASGLPHHEQLRLNDRAAPEVRASLLQFELLSSVHFRCGEDGPATLYCTDPARAPLITLSRPPRDYMVGQLKRVQTQAALRESRAAEILTQINPPIAFFASVVNLQPARHSATLELLQAALQFAYAVGMRFKQALAMPRPSEFSAQVQPMIEVPRHGAFPAGHAIEGHVLAGVLDALSGRPPLQRRMLRQLATRVAENRVVAGVHFPVDCEAGRLIGDAVAGYFVAACEGSAWRSARFDGASLPLDQAELRDFERSLEPFEDDPTPSPASHPAPDLPLLRHAWKRAHAEWTWPDEVTQSLPTP